MERIALAILTIFTLDRASGHFGSLYSEDAYGRQMPLGRHVIMVLWAIAVYLEAVWLRELFPRF